MKNIINRLRDEGKITQEECEELTNAMPESPAAWKALSTRYKNDLQRANAERDAALAREREKDAIIASFTTTGNPNYNADVNPFDAVVEYINKRRN